MKPEDRYKDNPLLRLVDCYILDTIGELPQQQRDTLEGLVPTLQEAFDSQGGWREIVAEQVGLFPSAAVEIEALWAAYQQDEQRLGRDPKPAGFVRDFVAQNFPGLLGDDAAPP